MAAATADRNLLFGMLALQLGFLDRDALLAAMQAWVFAKDRPLGDILRDQGKLTPERRDMLDRLVAEHLKGHGDDARQSLAALAPPDTVAHVLNGLADPDLQASLAAVSGPHSTIDHTPQRREAGADGLRYRIVRPHARGGLGAVFVALDQELHREVALKEIQPQLADDAASRGRFVQEAEITGGLEHPGIVPVYGLGQYADGRPFYAMRFIQGETLREAVRKFHAGAAGVTLRGLLTRFVAVCNAVAYAHSRGVIHRDLKPANVMLGKYGETLVVDWGLAKSVGRAEGSKDSTEVTLQPRSGDRVAVTQLGSALGTPAYMSPEQAVGQVDQLGPATDIYSLGATLYAILTGQPPIQGRDTAEVMARAREGDWPPARQVKSSAPAALDAVCRKAMALKPGDRYPTALALAADVDAWLADEPVGAYREPWPARAGRWLRRRRTLVVGVFAAMLVAALASGLGVVLLSAANERERDARGDAEQQRTEAEKRRDETRYHLYVSNINLASREWYNGNVPQVRQLLQNCLPQRPEDLDLRGWEWHYQDRLCRDGLRTFQIPAGLIARAVYSPDGARLVTNTGKTIQIRSAADGKQLHNFPVPAGGVRDLAYSPDGKRLALSGYDGSVRVWDASTGRDLEVFTGHKGWVYGVVFSPDGTRLASAGKDGTVRVWDVSGRRAPLILRGHDDSVLDVAFNHDGTRLASAGGDGTVRLWDPGTGKDLHVLWGHTLWVGTVVFSPDGARFATAGGDKAVRLWDAATGNMLRVLASSPATVERLAYSPDGRRLAACGGDGMIREWSATSGKELRVLRGHSDNGSGLTYHPDGVRLVSSSRDGTVREWDSASGSQPRTLQGSPTFVRDVAYSPDGTRLVSVDDSGAIREWDANGGRPLGIFLCPTSGFYGVAYHPRGKKVAVAGRDGRVREWDLLEGKQLRIFPGGHMGSAFRVTYHPDGTRLASADEDGTVRVWDTANGAVVHALQGHKGPVYSVTFTPDGKRLMSGGLDGTLREWNAGNGKELRVLKGHPGGARAISFSQDGSRFLSGGGDGAVREWDAGTGRELRILRGHRGAVYRVAYSPDGSRLASAGADGTVRVWDRTGDRELCILKNHTAPVFGLAFSPDGTRLASCSSDGTIQIADGRPWDPSAQVEREAFGLVAGLFGRPLLKADVLEQIRRHRGITEPVRARALELAGRTDDAPEHFDRASREVVRESDAPLALYRQALGWSQTACRLAPANGAYRTTLGIAHYRLGQHAEALAALTRAGELSQGPQPADLAFLAMVHHRLGNQEAARDALTRLRKEGGSNDEEIGAFQVEAATLFSGGVNKTGPPR
jgi:WD40 repeat protein